MPFKTSATTQNAAEKRATEFRKDLNNPRGRVKVYPVQVHELFSKEPYTEWIVEVN
jgi:hypothetical protein